MKIQGLRIVLIGLALLVLTNMYAQDVSLYRVSFTDKSHSEYSLTAPESFLSEKSVARRVHQHIEIDSTDLPVCNAYIKMLELAGADCLLTSRWNNTALIEVRNENLIERISRFSVVKKVEKVGIRPAHPSGTDQGQREEVCSVSPLDNEWYGRARLQIAVHHGDSLHAMGYRGEGMTIAVVDAGFYNVDVIDAFKSMKLVGVKDFVSRNSNVYYEHSHGLKVLSCMAANLPYAMVGTAPEANYLLLRTELISVEQPVEEDMWAAAVEYADSMGVDIVNTSLGYYRFDEPFDGYLYRELDGKTSMMSRTASMMADKGMLLVCSAGNTGDESWKKITVPADAHNVLTVGAVNKDGVNADFSAVGNTADGRIKPDVMAVGYEAAVIDDDGSVTTANGTSFAAPVFCGLAACLWQSCPWLTVKELIDIIHRSGNQYSSPDNILGYGIPDMMQAYRMGMKQKR